MLSKISKRQHFEMFFFLFSLENGIWHFMQTVSQGDSLHEMSNPVFWGKQKINLLPAESCKDQTGVGCDSDTL